MYIYIYIYTCRCNRCTNCRPDTDINDYQMHLLFIYNYECTVIANDIERLTMISYVHANVIQHASGIFGNIYKPEFKPKQL